MRFDAIIGEDEEDTRLLKEMAGKATAYLNAFRWCPPIESACLTGGVGKVVAVFLFEFAEKIGGTDDRLWVIVGDLPSAYMVVNRGDSCRGALESYCLLMDDWVAAIRSGGDFDDVFPVDAPRTLANADDLANRLSFIRLAVTPYLFDDPVG